MLDVTSLRIDNLLQTPGDDPQQSLMYSTTPHPPTPHPHHTHTSFDALKIKFTKEWDNIPKRINHGSCRSFSYQFADLIGD